MGLSLQDLEGVERQDAALQLSDHGDHCTLELHAAALFIERYRAREVIDGVMLSLSQYSAKTQLYPEHLEHRYSLSFESAIRESPFLLAEADPSSRELLKFGPGYRVSAEHLLKLYAYLIDGNRHFEASQLSSQ
jgi:hypothetical protein